jgi:hypothetical protein
MKKGIVDTVGDGYFDIAWNEANGLAIIFCHCVSLRRETVLQSVQAWGPSLEDHEDYRNYREIVLAAAFLAAWRLLAADDTRIGTGVVLVVSLCSFAIALIAAADPDDPRSGTY